MMGPSTPVASGWSMTAIVLGMGFSVIALCLLAFWLLGHRPARTINPPIDFDPPFPSRPCDGAHQTRHASGYVKTGCSSTMVCPHRRAIGTSFVWFVGVLRLVRRDEGRQLFVRLLSGVGVHDLVKSQLEAVF